jgi:hypothetical protein
MYHRIHARRRDPQTESGRHRLPGCRSGHLTKLGPPQGQLPTRLADVMVATLACRCLATHTVTQ